MKNLSQETGRSMIEMLGIPAIIGVLSDETYDGTNGYNSYGGKINIASKTDNASGRIFTIEYTGIPKDACVKPGTSDWGGDAGSGLVSIKIGSNSYTWTANNLPPSLTDVATSCANKTSNTLTWTYK